MTKNATVYNRYLFKTAYGNYVVYAVDGVDVFARLIEGYKP